MGCCGAALMTHRCLRISVRAYALHRGSRALSRSDAVARSLLRCVNAGSGNASPLFSTIICNNGARKQHRALGIARRRKAWHIKRHIGGMKNKSTGGV